MKSLSVCTLTCAIFVLSLGGCGEDRPLPDYLKKTWGISLSGFAGEYVVDSAGTQTYASTGTISVDGLGSKKLAVHSIVDPVVLGGETEFYVTNLDGSDERYFVYDQIHGDIEIGTPAKGVAVARNDNGTYAVWLYQGEAKEQEVQVPDGFEALKLVEQYNEFKSISPYILLTAFAVAHTAAPEARIAVDCIEKNSNVTPPVCDLFKEFCDCAACLVLSRRGACGPCPKL